MAKLGHDVIGIDLDAAKIALLAAGRPPFYEPGLPDVLTSAVASGRLRFSTDIADAAGSQVHFIAVGTPQVAGGGRRRPELRRRCNQLTASASRRGRPRRREEHRSGRNRCPPR